MDGRSEQAAAHQSGTEVELRTTRGNDVALIVAGLLLALMDGWAAGGGFWHITRDELRGTRGDWLVLPFYDLVGWRGVVAVVAGFAWWAACVGFGAAWRLKDRRSAVSARPEGVAFHPSIGPTFVPWSEVERVEWRPSATPAEVRVRLKRRFWSTWCWATSRTVSLNHLAVGLSVSAAHTAANAMESLRRDCCGHNSQAPGASSHRADGSKFRRDAD